MHMERPMGSPKVDMIRRTLGNPLQPGELGVLMARAGVGKTACLTHIAIEHLLQATPVLHICIDEVPEKIKVWYQEFMRNVAHTEPVEDEAKLQQQIEPLRFILAYLHHTFTPEKLEQSVANLENQANFHPRIVIIDGLDFDRISRSTVESLRDFAQRHRVSVWMSARTHNHITTRSANGIPYPCHEMDDLFQAILLIKPIAPGDIQLKVLKHDDHYMPDHPPTFVNPQTFLTKET